MERMVNQTLWYAIMLEPYQGEEYYENDTFIVRPFCWNEDDEANFDERYCHDNSWHFYHKPSGFRLAWYKYPLRGVEANTDISHEQFYAVLQDSMNSVPERCGGLVKLIDGTFEKWW